MAGRSGDTSPAYHARAVTPDDTNILTGGVCRGLYVGVSGDVKITTARGSDVTFLSAPIGILPVQAVRVFDTGTTATDIVALY